MREEKMQDYLIDSVNENKRLDFQNKIDVYNLDEELNFFNWDLNNFVLDAGCGNGNVIEKLLLKGIKSIHGLDFSKDRIAQAQERFKDQKTISFFQRSLEETGLSVNTYDKVICRYVYEHVTNPNAIIKELHRVLKPGGDIHIINFDDVFFGFYTKNMELNQQLKELKSKVPQDFEIARKIPQILNSHNFKNVEWQAQSYFFKGERLKLEMENNRVRLEQGKSHLVKYFSSESQYDQFASAYIEEMKDECNVMMMTKFLVQGTK